jgi:predicted acetyltransferase
MDISITQVSKDEKEILKNLLEKYSYEFSQYEDTDVNDFGLYGYTYLDHYWTDKNRFAYFIKVNGKLAGCIMVNDYGETEIKTDFSMAEFFVMYKYKRLGAGTYAVKYIFGKHKGKWQITYAQKNKPANEFWNKVVKEYTGGNFEKNENHKKYDDGLIRDLLIFDT